MLSELMPFILVRLQQMQPASLFQSSSLTQLAAGVLLVLKGLDWFFQNGVHGSGKERALSDVPQLLLGTSGEALSWAVDRCPCFS